MNLRIPRLRILHQYDSYISVTDSVQVCLCTDVSLLTHFK